MEKRIPATVWIAVLALGVVTAVQAALAFGFVREGRVAFGNAAFGVVLAVALLVGLLRGHRLAWQWGRYLALFLALIVSARAAVAIAHHESDARLTAAVVGGLALPLFAAALALTRPSAVAFYRLVCPLCAHTTHTAADLLFRKARCRSCGNVW